MEVIVDADPPNPNGKKTAADHRRTAALTADRNRRIDLAVKEVTEKNVPKRTAARMFNVKESTLRGKLKKINPGQDQDRPAPDEQYHGNCSFTFEQERVLCEHIREMAALGFGYSPRDVIEKAQEMIILIDKDGNKNKDRWPGKRWWEGFRRRHPDFDNVMPKKRTPAQAAITPEIMASYFQKLLEAFQIVDCEDKPVLIYNEDETGVYCEHKPVLIFTCRKDKVEAIAAGKSPNTTLVSCVNAIGECLPPYFVFKGQRVTEAMKKDTLDGTVFHPSDSGWINSVIFLDWVVNHFAKHVTRRPVIILYDGHQSHYTSDVIMRCRAIDIHLFVLPPNTTHKLQPLDVGVFGRFKKDLYSNIQAWMRAHPYQMIQREQLPGLICQTLKTSMTPNVIVSAFRKCGIFPLNPDAVAIGSIEGIGTLSKTKPTREDTVEMKMILDGITETYKTAKENKLKRKGRPSLIPPDGALVTSGPYLELKLQQEEQTKARKGNIFACFFGF